MISFRFGQSLRRVKIKTNQKLNQRMTEWLQALFNIKNQIIGFKTSDNKYYDVECFYAQKQQFYGQQVQILEGCDQMQISFTSQNLNSSSFIRPTHPNASQIHQKILSSDQCQQVRFVIINDLRSIQRNKLQDNKDVTIVFDVNNGFKKGILQSGDFGSYNNFKTNLFLHLNSKHPKYSNISFYIGKNLILKHIFDASYKTIVKRFLSRYQKSKLLSKRQQKQKISARVFQQPLEDQAPSFTTYHLQQRLNQQAAQDYLGKMHKQKHLKSFLYTKLMQKSQENFPQFYRIFCDGIMDNDYENFKHQLLFKVENNLQLLLSHVDELDLSRPVSRQQQRRNLKKSVANIQIVKTENYLEILDGLNQFLDFSASNIVKQYLIDENPQIFQAFGCYLSRDIDKQELARRLKRFISQQQNLNRPQSRSIQRPIKRTSEKEKQKIQENQAPMFGPSTSKQKNFSPIKYMSDIQSNYKQAWSKLQGKAREFAPEEYGLLYHYLQTKDDSISNFVQELEWNEEGSIHKLRAFLAERIKIILQQNFDEKQISMIEKLRVGGKTQYIYDNFRYQSDLQQFIENLKQQVKINFPTEAKNLKRKNSDSQLMTKNKRALKRFEDRKYSDQKSLNNGGLSPKSSSFKMSMEHGGSESPASFNKMAIFCAPWRQQLQQLLGFCSFTQEKKQQHIRRGFQLFDPSVYIWIRSYIQNKSGIIDIDKLKNSLTKNEIQYNHLLKILPVFNQFLKCFVDQGKITQKVRTWLVVEFIDLNCNIIGAFQQYFISKDQAQFIDTITLNFQLRNNDMQYYRTYLKRLEDMMRAIGIQDEITAEVFQLYPNAIKGLCENYYITGNTEDMLDTLHTMYNIQSNRRKIKIASLNFSGINLSPFQYDNGSQQIKSLNQIFQKLVKQQKGQFRFDLGKLDKIYQKNRYSIAYGSHIELINRKLPNKQEYFAQWDKQYKNSGISYQGNQRHIQNTKEFDFFIYNAVVLYLYKVENLDNIKELQSNKLVVYVQSKNVDPLQAIQNKKLKVLNYIFRNNVDVMFIQQGSSAEWGDALPPQYSHTKNADSIIIYNKYKLGNQKNSLTDIYKEQLNFNEDSSCLFTDRNYLLISGHLKSNNLNIQQAKQMFQTLNIILQEHPMLKIIVGIDANHFLSKNRSGDNFSIVPEEQNIPTTRKKRSYLQSQWHKAGVDIVAVKDHLISNKNIMDCRIEDIEGNQTEDYIPNNTHPYDHFVVSGRIQ